MPPQAGDMDRVIHDMVDRIVAHCGPEQVILFGSHARGAADEHSDVDLLVVMPNGTHRRLAASGLYALLAGSGVAKDIVVATAGDIERRDETVGTILSPAIREGRVLYDRRA